MLNRHIYEGWTLQDFINELEPIADMIMRGESWQKPFKTKEEISKWCTDNQSYYKKEIPEVIQYFCERYGIC